MGLDQPPGQRQPQAGAGVVPVGVADLLELLEHPVMVVGGDADAGVGDGDRHDGAAGGGDRDPAALGGELDRVGEQVLQDLPEPDPVGERGEHRQVRLDGAGCLPSSSGARPVSGLLDGGVDPQRAQAQVQAARLDLGQVEDVVDQAEQVPAAGVDVVHPFGRHVAARRRPAPRAASGR